MINLDFGSRVSPFLDLFGIRNSGSPDTDDRQLERHLLVLRWAPEPQLERGRDRVLAEAARLESGANRRVAVTHQTRLSLIGGAALLVVAVIVYGLGLISWAAPGTATRIPSTAVNAPGGAVLTASATESEWPTATLNPTPARVSFVVPAAAATPTADAAPAPARKTVMTITSTKSPSSP